MEVVPIALDCERVLAFAALRVRKASTRAPGSARGQKATAAILRSSQMDAGDADLEVVVAAVLDDERVLAVAALRVRIVDTSVEQRARTRCDGGGDPEWTRETLT